jgi:hypothetical protein
MSDEVAGATSTSKEMVLLQPFTQKGRTSITAADFMYIITVPLQQ